MPAKKKTAPVREAETVYTPEWAGLVPGDPVKVSTPFLDGKRGYRWVFRAHVQNTRTGAEWIDCYGGRTGYEGLSSFATDAVTAIPKKVRRARRKG